jgi:hypothetical protein
MQADGHMDVHLKHKKVTGLELPQGRSRAINDIKIGIGFPQIRRWTCMVIAHISETYLEPATREAPRTTKALGADQLIRANETTGTTVPAIQEQHIGVKMQSPICLHV